MALLTGLGQAATVAQLVGADVGGLISMTMQAALTARQNRAECEQLARRVLMIAQLLPHVQLAELEAAARPLAGLGDVLRDAHELVVSCQGRSAAYQFVMAGRTADRFREVQGRIDSYLILFPVISHIGITRRLERIYNVLVPDNDSTTGGEPSYPPPPRLSHTQSLFQESSQEMAQEVEVVRHGTEEFTLAEIMDATNGFARDAVIGYGGGGRVYKGRLHDGREVAVKRVNNLQSNNIQLELDILSRLRHKHIVRLLGSCVTAGTDKRKKRLLTTKRRKEPEEEPEGSIVYEYMENGTLYDHLHHNQGSSAASPLRVCWKMRIEVLLCVSRAIKHLHCHAVPPIIHRDIKSSNILFDARWVPHVSDFGSSLTWHVSSVKDSGLECPVMGTFGYVDPEYCLRGRVKPASDVYSLGVLMLEVLTGKRAFLQGGLKIKEDLACFASPIIEAGDIMELLDKRPVPGPTSLQLQALKRVAQIARCCVKWVGRARPAISDIVANLEMVHKLICRDEPCLVEESVVWPFLEKVDESPHAKSVPLAGYQPNLVHQKLTELCSH
ncbi:putative serine/threonine-protein kinase-like protein CCR3 isoform X1 [Triticum urartu]|nr:putative serine/threonine-protein kinase-like protein CCR3 isoform X1 [Triticum urartu]